MEENPYKGILEVGKVYTYKELCEAFNEKVASGNAKKTQVKRWARCFSWEHPISKRTSRPSKKFLIIEVYDIPKEKEARKSNSSKGRSRVKFNDYKICGDYVVLYIKNCGEVYTCIIYTEDLELVRQERKYSLFVNHIYSIDGVWIHRLIKGLPKLEGRIQSSDLVVHHINGVSIRPSKV